jgi:ubiquinone/menaquinone biosynthesis C-methylase UbiE
VGFKLTNKHTKYWKERKIDWQTSYSDTWNHPHRSLITFILKSIPFVSLWEVGCGSGPNLIRITRELPNKQLGGSDVNEDAINLARETFKGGLFHVEPGNDLMMSDKSCDVMLTDMALIYVDPLQINSYLRELKRVGREYVVLCEFHSTSWWKRQVARWGGYHVYDYRKRLEKLGFFDIMVQHIPEQYWPGTDNNTEFRTIITARIPKRI